MVGRGWETGGRGRLGDRWWLGGVGRQVVGGGWETGGGWEGLGDNRFQCAVTWHGPGVVLVLS